MMMGARGSFSVTSWDEKAYQEGDGRKLTLAVVGQDFAGAVEGKATARWLMSYRPDGTARFVGLQQVDGTFAGRRGQFVLETVGDFDGQTARWQASVVDGSGSGELAGLSGSGTFGAEHGSQASYTMDLALDAK
jgi:Protein of unknown function (DUF3224)